jgi:hypothetical protein
MLSLRDLQEHISNGRDLVVLSNALEMPRPCALEKLEALGVAVMFESM